MELSRVFFFRHGQTDWNVQQRFQGHLDIPLNDTGRSQAKALIPLLELHKIEAILTSDLSRTLETAEIISKKLQIPVYQTETLREAFLGDAQGMTHIEIEAKFGTTLYQKWHSTLISDADISYPGGESGKQVLNRALSYLQDFLTRKPFQCVGVSTHGGVVRRILTHFLPEGMPTPYVQNAGLYELTFDKETTHWTVKS